MKARRDDAQINVPVHIISTLRVRLSTRWLHVFTDYQKDFEWVSYSTAAEAIDSEPLTVVGSGRVAHGSFHRNTSKIKVSAKFHYPIRDRKRKKEPESTSCIALIMRFNHASYLNLSLQSTSILKRSRPSLSQGV